MGRKEGSKPVNHLECVLVTLLLSLAYLLSLQTAHLFLPHPLSCSVPMGLALVHCTAEGLLFPGFQLSLEHEGQRSGYFISWSVSASLLWFLQWSCLCLTIPLLRNPCSKASSPSSIVVIKISYCWILGASISLIHSFHLTSITVNTPFIKFC